MVSFLKCDFQSRNIMATPPPRGLVLIDFQDALLGPAIYDVVALFRDSYVSIEPATLDRLLAGAFTRLAGLPGIPATEAEFRRFVEAAKAQAGANAPESIGQFGGGFYSAFMVADQVTVDSLAIHTFHS
jgi:aminoglycoside/choline kinase family phosphotransferase